jgi:hypothetical protein
MNSKKLYFILLSSIGLLIIALIGGAYGADMLLSKQADELINAKAKSLALETKQQQLVKAKNDIIKYKSLSDIAKSVVPQDKDQAQTIREIVNLANANGIRLGGITFPSSSLGTAVVTPKPATGGDAAANSTPATPAPAPAVLPQSQLKAVPTIPGVFDLAITVQSDATAPADYSQLIKFLAALENNRRTAIVSGITLTPDGKDPSKIAFSLNINEYIKP